MKTHIDSFYIAFFPMKDFTIFEWYGEEFYWGLDAPPTGKNLIMLQEMQQYNGGQSVLRDLSVSHNL